MAMFQGKRSQYDHLSTQPVANSAGAGGVDVKESPQKE